MLKPLGSLACEACEFVEFVANGVCIQPEYSPRNAAMLRRLIISSYVLFFAGGVVGSASFLWQTRAEYLRMCEVEAQSRARLALAERKLGEERLTLDRMRNDPAYVEMVIRRRLGYARPGEMIVDMGL